jgi:ATP-binding cassette, subfamily B, vacuolar membrane transporter HMT1/ACLQ
VLFSGGCRKKDETAGPFDKTLMYNIKYARPTAKAEEIQDECRIASIHEWIISFVEGV